jgi:adenylate kinase family enzyme
VRVTFVTGVSGSGKSTLGRELAESNRSGLVTRDIDDGGTPNVGHLDWLHWRAAELLHEAVQPGEPGDADHYVITGITWPHAVIDSSAWPAALDAKADVRFVLLSIPPKVMKTRLTERLADRKASERREILRYNRQLAGVLRRQVEQQRTGDVLAAHRMTPGEIAAYVADGC